MEKEFLFDQDKEEIGLETISPAAKVSPLLAHFKDNAAYSVTLPNIHCTGARPTSRPHLTVTGARPVNVSLGGFMRTFASDFP